MAVAAWLVWQRRGAHLIGVSAVLFGSQLALNALWSFVFFNGRNIGLAFVDIALLWVALGATVWWFWSVRPAAGALLVPYFLWVSFAMALNYSILKLNA
jgi:tryptophan-rich sensory protein